MHGPKGWNINTYVSIGGFVILLAGMVYTEGQSSQKLQSTVDAFASYQTDTDNRIAQIEAQTRQLDSLAYRIGAAEASNAAVSRIMSDLQASVAQQSGDIKVVREILQRLERQASPVDLRPLALSAVPPGIVDAPSN